MITHSFLLNLYLVLGLAWAVISAAQIRTALQDSEAQAILSDIRATLEQLPDPACIAAKVLVALLLSVSGGLVCGVSAMAWPVTVPLYILRHLKGSTKA